MRGRRRRGGRWGARCIGIGAGNPPTAIHAGDCHMVGARRRPIDREEARRLLAAGLPDCSHCQPRVQLHILDLAVRRVWNRTV
ncbi:DUF6233 domain-containing protein [Streptomyces flaveus]|uniref:DUF6233 domain-containing protein n=1 Tax=Streptomyces flaveus TaxID=66370 RepID=UPI00331C2569